MLESFTLETFRPYLHDSFQIISGSTVVVQLELISVTTLEQAGTQINEGAHVRPPFSLVFRGPAEVVLPQHIYRIQHAQLGSFDLFLVPIGPDREGMRYEAVFT
jgi:hypothetical protein